MSRCWKCGAMGKWNETINGKLACSRCVRKQERKGETPVAVKEQREEDSLKRENVWLKESKTELAASVKALEAQLESIRHQLHQYKTSEEVGFAPMQQRLEILEAYVAANEAVMEMGDASRETQKETWMKFGEARKRVIT